MPSPRVRVVLVSIILLALVSSLGVRLFQGPRHQGRTVESWCKQLWAGSTPEQAAAADALKAMGSTAVPELRRMLARRDSRLRTWFLRLCSRQHLVRYPYMDSDTDQQRIAIKALGILGEPAREALPDLRHLVTNWTQQRFDVNETGRVANFYEPGSTPMLEGGPQGPRLRPPPGPGRD